MASHKQLSNWYHQLAQQIEAGIPLAEAFLLAEGPPAAGRKAIHNSLLSGATIEATMRAAPKWLPFADRIFIAAAADTGRLPQTFLNLSERHARIAGTNKRVILGLIYPVGVFHVASFALPLVRMIDFEVGFEWDFVTYISMVLAMLLPFWGLILCISLLAKTTHPILPKILRRIPLLGRYLRLQAIADFADSLGTFIDAGISISSAWQGSVRIANDPRLTKVYQESIRPIFQRGEDPASELAQHKIFPQDLVAYYQAGQSSGKLDQTLHKAGKQFQEQANQALNTCAVVYPTLLFAVVAGFIIYSIFQVYGGYLKNITDIMDP